MNGEKTPEEQLAELANREALKIISALRGSGATVDDPCRLGAMHSLLAPITERFVVSYIYGKKDVDWFDAGRTYHKNGKICEQRVRLGVRVDPKLFWAQPGHTYSMFFDLSELTHEAQIPDEVKQFLTKEAAARWPVADTTLVSRFPLIEVRAKNAVEAARVIARHLRAAEAQGWKTGEARALVDNWRNEYELTKGNEKTVMQFDMRPCLLSDSSRNLILTMLATQPKLEEVLREFERSSSLTNALTVSGAKLVETSFEAPDISFDRRDRNFYWNTEALHKRSKQKVKLVGETSTVELLANDTVFYLMVAKSLLDWKGGEHLFQRTQNGFALTLQDRQTVSRSDAAELSKLLNTFSETHPDPANPCHKTIRLLAAIAEAAGFSIECEREGPTQTLSRAPRLSS
jgi:hypothetical protein